VRGAERVGSPPKIWKTPRIAAISSSALLIPFVATRRARSAVRRQRPAAPGRGELLDQELDLLPQSRGPAEVLGPLGLGQLLAQIREPHAILVAGAGVEHRAGVPEVGAGGELAIGPGAQAVADVVASGVADDIRGV
jgi:hypothetical protein